MYIGRLEQERFEWNESGDAVFYSEANRGGDRVYAGVLSSIIVLLYSVNGLVN